MIDTITQEQCSYKINSYSDLTEIINDLKNTQKAHESFEAFSIGSVSVAVWVAMHMIVDYVSNEIKNGKAVCEATFTLDLFTDPEFTIDSSNYQEPLYHSIKYCRYGNVGGFETSTNKATILSMLEMCGLIEKT